MIPVIGFGAGGHAKVVIEILRSMQGYQIIGLLEMQKELWHTSVLGVEVMGDDSKMAELKERGIEHAFIGVGTVGDAGPRRELYKKVSGFGFQMVPAIHAKAIVSSSAQIGDGPTIMAGAIVNAGAVIGNNVIVNTGAIVEHDCVIADHVHIATGARLAGGVRVGPASHVGIGAVVRQEITIGEGAIVGAGAVVVRDVLPGTTVIGVPAGIK
ncbi:MAG TPA: acetyltransferase [Pyrinomonadaceae bacterium]|nr:acetyltransferase [Pyrinomonadaceae bacterium]